MRIKILQYNTQSLTANNNKQLLELFLVNNNIDIAILSEIWVSNNSMCSLEIIILYVSRVTMVMEALEFT